MVQTDITYERSVNKSFMKIPAVETAGLDEKLIFHKQYRGILPVEKCYVNGEGQYWYNITGKQALDTYCKVNSIEPQFFEMLILRICSQLEILDWNLIDTRCLVMDPELIFMNHDGEEVSFILYPDPRGDFFEELQKLMEYLLTKLNHEDREGMKQPYRIYEMSLTKAFRLEDLKQVILSGREKEPVMEKEEIIPEAELEVAAEEEHMLSEIEKKFKEWTGRIREILWKQEKVQEGIPMVVYPEDEEEEKEEVVINPTICLTAALQEPMGHLLYEGIGNYPDFQIEKEMCVLGKNPRVKLYLDKDTISQFHAKFDYREGCYYLEDMNSTNGTFVNDEVLNYKEKKVLSPGDLIRFADVKYRFL